MTSQRLNPGRLVPIVAAISAATAGLFIPPAQASSHREAPFITSAPKVDASDFYMFDSYETGRSDYVTLIANYQPLQDAYGGPNYFSLDPNALYEIHVDNNGDAQEDITFQFRFKNKLAGVALPIGDKQVAIPLVQAGQVTDINPATLNVTESYTLNVVRGDRRKGTVSAVTGTDGKAEFTKPVDNIGTKTIPDYAGYAAKHIYTVNIPGCSQPAKVFVGQRKDPFRVNLGVIFDLVHAPVGVITDSANINAGKDSLADKNVTTMALEVHKSCLLAAGSTDTVIGGWTTASLRQGRLLDPTPKNGLGTTDKSGGAWTQVSRLGNPLVNEVVIGIGDKDKFNGSKPKDDGANFLTYVTNPTLPRLLEIALGLPAGGVAPTNLPRTDLATTFLTGITGVNKPATVTASEMLRLNTALPPVPFAQQNRLGLAGEALRLGGVAQLLATPTADFAGFPNGRRPKDDVVDIALVAMAGGLCVLNGTNNALGMNGVPGVPSLTSKCDATSVPLGATSAKLHDAVDQAQVTLLPGFPYLNTPLPGATD